MERVLSGKNILSTESDAKEAHMSTSLRNDSATEEVLNNDGDRLLSSNDAELVRWCEPYAGDILRHHIRNERKTVVASSISEADRKVIVNWICNVSRREQFKSETFWTAVSTFDRFLSSISQRTASSQSNAQQQPKRQRQEEDRIEPKDLQSVAAACIQLAASYQETAMSPDLNDLVESCDSRYTKTQLRAMCWRVTVAVGADLYWPTPLTFYRHYSRALRQTTLEHTMTKFIVETIAFAREALLARFWPSMLAACALFVAQWCTYYQLPSEKWLADWNALCFPSLRRSEQLELIDCLSALAEWIRATLGGTPSIAHELESVLRRYAHRELFCVSKIAQLPENAAALARFAVGSLVVADAQNDRLV